MRLVRLRGFGASLGLLTTCACARLDFGDGSQGILVRATEPPGRDMRLRERLRLLVEGIETAAAVFARDGMLVAATFDTQSLLGWRDLSDPRFQAAHQEAVEKGRAEIAIGDSHVRLQRVGTGDDIGVIAFLAPNHKADSSGAAASTFDEFAEPPVSAPTTHPETATGENSAHIEPPNGAPEQTSPRGLPTRRHPLRFTWQMDGDGQFWLGPDEFTHLIGARTAAGFGRPWQAMQMNLIYDVCHNIAKLEEHALGGKRKRVWVHRKGATRAFPPDHPEVPAVYRRVGQPVIIPGDMGRASWVLVGQPGSMERTFGTTCHGAGRAMSRTAAVKHAGGRRIDKELESRGVIARAQSRKGLAEEQPRAYKNVDDVVEVVDRAGLSRKVARMRPIGVIKG